jgi:hypothetical protein
MKAEERIRKNGGWRIPKIWRQAPRSPTVFKQNKLKENQTREHHGEIAENQ